MKLLRVKDLAATQALIGGLAFLLIPLLHLLGWGADSLPIFLHSLLATFTLASAFRVVHLLFPFLRGNPAILDKLHRYLWLTGILSLLSTICGNWLYQSYRVPDGPQQWFMFHHPAAHFVLMEFKEIIGLFPLPLYISGAWIVGRFGERISEQRSVSAIVALLATAAWACLLIVFVLGIGLSKMRSI